MLAVAFYEYYTDRLNIKQDCQEIEDRMSYGESTTQSTVPAPAMTPTRTVTTPARSGRETVQYWTEADDALDVAD